jgi:hypothetical protein
VATMATGTGKFGFFVFLMLVICALSRDPNLTLSNIYVPEDPAMIIICPTKALREDMVSDCVVFCHVLTISLYGCLVCKNEGVGSRFTWY